jgi:catechol 2,3-dioxygenase-like lactoylglutathione lyase family enzyme
MKLTHIHPKLPMRDKAITRQYYLDHLGFEDIGSHDFPEYLILAKDQIELHFFLFPDLNPAENDGQVYIRVEGIEDYYQDLLKRKAPIHPNGPLQSKPWGQKEFAILDPDHNLLTFGESIPSE